jgi:hypothetical protein
MANLRTKFKNWLNWFLPKVKNKDWNTSSLTSIQYNSYSWTSTSCKAQRLKSISYSSPPVGLGCHGQAVAKHSSFPMVSHWFPRLADLRRNTRDKVLTSLTGLAMVSCFSVQRPHTTGIIQQEITVYFDCAHGMAIQIFLAARCT